MNDPRLTPAQFKALRERLGLTTKWLADRFDVALFSVKRWERERAAPDGVAFMLLQLLDWHNEEVEQGVKDHEQVIRVPRLDEGEFPAAWHRSVALDVAARTGALIDWDGQTTEFETEGDHAERA